VDQITSRKALVDISTLPIRFGILHLPSHENGELPDSGLLDIGLRRQKCYLGIVLDSCPLKYDNTLVNHLEREAATSIGSEVSSRKGKSPSMHKNVLAGHVVAYIN
jgi:hypothetical protein